MNSTEYAEVVNFAESVLRGYQEHFDQASKARVASQVAQYWYGDRERLMEIAETDSEAATAVTEVGAQLLEHDEQIPADLGKFLACHLRNGPSQRDKKRPKHTVRDLYIALTVWRVCERTGWNPTRSNSSKKVAAKRAHSACEAVHEALLRLCISISENGVAKIWQEHRDLCNGDSR